jgi:hypothetical protein
MVNKSGRQGVYASTVSLNSYNLMHQLNKSIIKLIANRGRDALGLASLKGARTVIGALSELFLVDLVLGLHLLCSCLLLLEHCFLVLCL